MNVIFGGIYTENQKLRIYLPRYYEYLNDQKNHYWFPIRVVKDGEDDIYMLDTYQFEMPYECRNNYAKMVEYLKSLGEPKDNTWEKNKAYDYYYSAVIQLTKQNIEAFDLVANLEEYEIVDSEQARYYDEKYVIKGVMMWNYHGSGRGVHIKRKDAKLQYDLMIDNLYFDVINSIKKPDISTWYVDKLLECEKEAIKNGAIYDKKKVEYVLKIQKYVNKAYKNYIKYRDKIKEEMGIERA